MRTDTRLEYRQRIEMAIEFILENLDTPPTVVEIADYAGFSRFHFGRVFSMAVGESLAEFVRRLRMERSAWQLENTSESVGDIAIRAGYESLEGFSRAFREWFHVPPSEFRQMPTRHQIQSPSRVHWCPKGRRSTPVLVLNEDTNMEATIEKLDDMTVVALRHVGPYYEIGPKFVQLVGWTRKHNVPMNMGVAIYYNNPDDTAASELQSDAAMVVPQDFVLPDTEGQNIGVVRIPGGDHAKLTHIGPYDGLGDAWARLMGPGMTKIGREFASRPPFEIYRNDCTQVKPEELRTDLYVPLK